MEPPATNPTTPPPHLPPCGPLPPTAVTCLVRYTIDPTHIDAFEAFAHAWMRLVTQHGGLHHGYFLPSEGASDYAQALFTFPSLTAYEQYRSRFNHDPDFIAANQIRDQSKCVLRYERTFLRPLLPASLDPPPHPNEQRHIRGHRHLPDR